LLHFDCGVAAKTGVACRRVFDELLKEVVMVLESKHVALAAISIAIGTLAADVAFAAQGPGTGAGTASSLTQTAMTIIVYGTSALVVGAGLIGALRKQ
jgi:hypothetical protein